MATKLKTYDFSTHSRLTDADKATYPWEEWFDGDPWRITYGEDFEGHPLMMERIIRTRATGRKARVSVKHESMNGEPWGYIVLQRTDIVGPYMSKRNSANTKRMATRQAKKAPAEVNEATVATKPDVKTAPVSKKVPAKANGTNGHVPSKRPSKKVAATV